MAKKEGMNKGLKITLIVVGIIVALIIILVLFSRIYKQDNINNDNREGWSQVSLQNDSYKMFFPQKYIVASGDILLYDNDSIQKRENVWINPGSSSLFFLLENRRALYKPENKDPSFKVWFEQVNNTDYIRYSEFIKEYMAGIKKEGENQKSKLGIDFNYGNFSYNHHDYYIYVMTELGPIPRIYSSIGEVYVLFPEYNSVYFIDLFNTKYQNCFPDNGPDCKIYDNEKLLSQEEVEDVVKQLIDSVVSSK